jgi:hypothetical protein
MRHILYSITMIVFISYWSITFIFNAPDNYINISLYKYNQLFQTFFYQKWSFFAPPPTFNERLYYEFRNIKDSSVMIFEAAEPICIAKQKNSPFNSKDDLLDYIISGSVNGVSDQMHELQESFKLDNLKKGKGDLDSLQYDTIKKFAQKSLGFHTLRNYAKYVAITNKLDITKYEIKIMFTRVPLPKFADRLKNEKAKEEMYFISNYFKM